MKESSSRALQECHSLIIELQLTEIRLSELKQKLSSLPDRVAVLLLSEEERHELASLLYWHSDISVPVIGDRLFGCTSSEVAGLVGLLESEFSCNLCKETIFFRTRTHRAQFLSATAAETLCESCKRVVEEQQIATHRQSMADKHRLEDEERHRRLAEIESLPFEIYLQTPEWEDRQYTHVQDVHGFCQRCNRRAEEGLMVMHRHRKVAQGRETFGDLIAICISCHTKRVNRGNERHASA